MEKSGNHLRNREIRKSAKKPDEIGISREIGSLSKKSRNHQGNHEIWKSCTLNWPVSDPSEINV